MSRDMLSRFAPALFVLIWSSGFVVARFAFPHGAPELVLVVRLALTATCLGAMAAYAKEAWPRGRRFLLHLLAGALLNGVYLCTSWWAIERGLPAGVMSLLGALQPLVVAVASFFVLKERLSAAGWAGLAVGLTGVVLVLLPVLGRSSAASVSPAVVAGAVLSILALSAGVMIQRGALARDGLMASGALQNGAGAVVALLATAALGDYRWDNSGALWFAVGWSVLMLSIGALSLLVWMTRAQGPTRVSLLLLLVPPITAVETWVLFGERLSGVQLLGFVIALGGVLLARRSPRAAGAQVVNASSPREPARPARPAP